jgi:Domain of unknown function (DUF1707)
MREDGRQRATEFVKELYAAGEIDADRLENGIAGVLAATSEAELAEVVRSLPAPVALTSRERRLARPLEIHSGWGRLRLAGRWQVGRETHISADLGSIRLDLTQAEFDDHVIDLHIYTGSGSITIVEFDAGQVAVEDDHVVGVDVESGRGFQPVAGDVHGHALVSQAFGHPVGEGAGVLGHQDSPAGCR